VNIFVELDNLDVRRNIYRFVPRNNNNYVTRVR